MINRYVVEQGVIIGQQKDGQLVDYDDHAAEMREVLEALRLYAGPHGGDVKDFEAWFAVNKYAHYLEEK